MITLPSISVFRQWQIQHYTERLAAATTTKAKAWLRNELYHLKKSSA